MDRISGLSDELLVKILSFVPTKVAVSTSLLSKRWELLWMWVPKLDSMEIKYGSHLAIKDFINKNLPLLRAPVIESFCFNCHTMSFPPEDINQWVATTVSRSVRELDIDCSWFTCSGNNTVLLPSSLFTCGSLVTLKLHSEKILVDVPRTVSLPSLKTLLLHEVTYLNKDSLRLLLSYCPVLEDLVIRRSGFDNAKGVVVVSPSLLRLTLQICSINSCSDEFVIVTHSLKYFKVEEYDLRYSYLVTHMPNVEEADIVADEYLLNILDPVMSVKRLSLCVLFNFEERFMKYDDDIFFNRLEHLKLCIRFDNWSKLLFRLLHDSPNLRVLNLYVAFDGRFKKYEPISWNSGQISVPSCLLESLETFEFAEYRGSQEERDFVSFIIKNACHLKSSIITPCTEIETYSSADSSND